MCDKGRAYTIHIEGRIIRIYAGIPAFTSVAGDWNPVKIPCSRAIDSGVSLGEAGRRDADAVGCVGHQPSTMARTSEGHSKCQLQLLSGGKQQLPSISGRKGCWLKWLVVFMKWVYGKIKHALLKDTLAKSLVPCDWWSQKLCDAAFVELTVTSLRDQKVLYSTSGHCELSHP